MNLRKFGRTGWNISELGYGMWGLAAWSDSDAKEIRDSLQLAVDLGCNFFDTAAAYGNGLSERMLGQLLRDNPGKKLYTATKVAPKNQTWPSQRGFKLDDVFPADHIRQSVDQSLANLGTSSIDLLQFHVWEDDWASDERWQRAVSDLKSQGLISATGVSINRWEPANAIRTLRTGLIDAVQVIYNIFDQAPEDELFPVCRELNVGVIARVPFDEGSLTDTLTRSSTWPANDWRGTYFVPENLNATLDHVDRLRPVVPPTMNMPEMAIRFILSNPDVSTVIPGMRKPKNVRANVVSSDRGKLDAELLRTLAGHRWDRTPTRWSQ
jgi:aryl-alcohol dehydrogenase-like predicted oxidoreductase